MATITLNGGNVIGKPTSGDDVVTSTDLVTDPRDFGVFDYFLKTGKGNDTIDLTKSFTASGHTIWTGAGNDTVTGGGGNFYDGSGNDTYRLTGTAFIFAGAGDDTYDGGKGLKDNFGGDYVSFEFKPSDNGAQKTHTQDLKINLAKTTPWNLGIFGSDTLISIESLAGGNGDDTFYGTGATNFLVGGGGNDKLWGLGGNDDLTGGDGSDRLNGGKGADTYNLFDRFEIKRDKVVISALSDLGRYSSNNAKSDIVLYFDPGKNKTDDRIDLSSIVTPNADGKFLWRGTGGFHDKDANWEVRVTTKKLDQFSTAVSTIVQIDTDNDTKAEYSIVVKDVSGLHSYDFFL
jgi:Ca2+-binding RTX toxin-like protein